MSAATHLPARLAPRAPVLGEHSTDLSVGTLDNQGRLSLRGPARLMGWDAAQTLVLDTQDGVLRFSADDPTMRGQAGLALSLDRRSRVQLPFGLRFTHGLRAGSRVLIVAAPTEGAIAVLPVSRVVAAFASRT